MLTVLPITQDFAVSPALATHDFARVAELGYRTVIGFVPEGENPLVPTAEASMAAARQNGLTFVHIPASKYDLLTDEVVTAALHVLESAQGPVLGACVSGQRAAIVWAGAASRTQPVEQVLQALSAAGFNLSFLRDDLETQAQRARLEADGFSRAA